MMGMQRIIEDENGEKLYLMPEAADRIGVSKALVRMWKLRKKWSPIEINGHSYMAEDDLKGFLNSKKINKNYKKS